MRHWNFATKAAAVVTAIMVTALATSGLLAWRRSDAEILALQLSAAEGNLVRQLSIGRALFDARFPGSWRLVPAAGGGGADAPQTEDLQCADRPGDGLSGRACEEDRVAQSAARRAVSFRTLAASAGCRGRLLSAKIRYGYRWWTR